MSVALLGLIMIQFYWTHRMFVSQTDEFNGRVYRAMNATVEELTRDELQTYYQRFQDIHNDFSESTEKPQVMSSQLIQDSAGTTYITMTRYILERSVIPLSKQYNDSLISAKLYSQEKIVEIPKDSGANMVQNLSLDAEENFKNSTFTLERLARLDMGNKPLDQRTDEKSIDSVFVSQLQKIGVQSQPKFAVLKADSALTKVVSPGFDIRKKEYTIPLFYDNNDRPQYLISAYFPDKKLSILGPIIPIVMLTVIFTIIIISVFSLAVYYMQFQRTISEIKTDFINNMTHEFKTPIATINLALDAMKNPKMIEDKEKTARYLKMIKDENKRMHAQVENVLRISKLERNELNISKDRVKLHDLIEDAIMHVELIIEDRQGYIKTHLNAEKSSVLANDTHLTNVLVNILDNAIKYSDDAPRIDVTTENVGNSIILKIADQGNGMTKQVQKKVFEKFYREHTGNVHNVKGHGLGLAYVKRMVEDHHGHVSVESEKGKGSTFIIKLPLIS